MVTKMNIATLSEQIKNEICIQLGFDPNHPPADLNPEEAAHAIHSTIGTLGVWRSTGRHSIPFYKIGNRIRYRLIDIAEWKAARLNIEGIVK